MTTSDNEWRRVVQRVTTNDNEWQQTTMSDSEWQQVAQRVTTNDNEWQQMTMSDSEWQKVVQRVKKTHLLQKMDDCNSFYNENRHTTSKNGWLILEWSNRLPLISSKKVAGLKKWPFKELMAATTPQSVLNIWIASSALVKKRHYHRKNGW